MWFYIGGKTILEKLSFSKVLKKWEQPLLNEYFLSDSTFDLQVDLTSRCRPSWHKSAKIRFFRAKTKSRTKTFRFRRPASSAPTQKRHSSSNIVSTEADSNSSMQTSLWFSRESNFAGLIRSDLDLKQFLRSGHYSSPTFDGFCRFKQRVSNRQFLLIFLFLKNIWSHSERLKYWRS